MALEKELETYHHKFPQMTDQHGKFVLIHGETVVDFFAAYEDAIKAGYQQFKLDSFLVKQVDAVEVIQYITRHILPVAEQRAH